jgi:DNA-binding transcriptional ArsR family regulator
VAVWVAFNQMVDKVARARLALLVNHMVDEGSPMTDELSRVFAALADPTRRDLVARLTEGDATVGDLAAPYDVSLQAVSKHLKVLEDSGLVTRSRDAQRRPVHLEAEVLSLMTAFIERYRRQAQDRFERLDAVLADAQGAPSRPDQDTSIDPAPPRLTQGRPTGGTR